MVVALFTRSQYVHAAIGDREIVCDPGMDGDRVWSQRAYILVHPTVAAYCEVPGEFVAAGFVPSHKRRWMPPCIRTVKGLMRRSGFAVPWYVRSPAGLARWLERKGYDIRELV